MPGNNGGANVGGTAIDPVHGTMVVVSKDLPGPAQAGGRRPERRRAGEAHPPRSLLRRGRRRSPLALLGAVQSGFGFLMTTSGLSAIAPPWTTITAYDLNTAEDQVAGAARRGAGARPAAGITGDRLPLPEGRPSPHRWRADLHRHTRPHRPRTGRRRRARCCGRLRSEPAGVEGIPAVYGQNRRTPLVVFCAAARATTRTHALPGYPASDAPVPGAYVAFALPDGK